MKPIKNNEEPETLTVEAFKAAQKESMKTLEGTMADLAVELKENRQRSKESQEITRLFVIVVTVSIIGTLAAIATMYIDSHRQMTQACINNDSSGGQSVSLKDYSDLQMQLLRAKNPRLK